MIHFSKITGGFYPTSMRAAYESAGTWPADAVDITAEDHAALMAGQSEGKIISIGINGIPELKDAPIDQKAKVRANIATLESSITLRRLREAIVSGDKSFISGVDASIAKLRAQLLA